MAHAHVWEGISSKNHKCKAFNKAKESVGMTTEWKRGGGGGKRIEVIVHEWSKCQSLESALCSGWARVNYIACFFGLKKY